MTRDCEVCDRPNKRGGRWCSRCYQARYRANPERRARHRQAVTRYQKANPEKRREWVRNYLARIGWYNPDLRALRAALKRVEQALAAAAGRQSLRGPG